MFFLRLEEFTVSNKRILDIYSMLECISASYKCEYAGCVWVCFNKTELQFVNCLIKRERVLPLMQMVLF